METYKEELFKGVFLSRLRDSIPSFVIDENNKEILRLLVYYFTEDPRFEAGGLSLEKGIMLMGPVGCGKTTIMKALRRNPDNCFMLLPTKDVAAEFRQDEYGITDRYGRGKMRKQMGVCFDDLGLESNIRIWGEEVNVMEEIIYSRYEKLPFRETHFTTNLTADQIEERYGTRIRSRLREMTNIITFDPSTPDMRR